MPTTFILVGLAGSLQLHDLFGQFALVRAPLQWCVYFMLALSWRYLDHVLALSQRCSQ